MIEERETKTLSRIMISNAGRSSIITGKFLGLFMICLMQTIAKVTINWWGMKGYLDLMTGVSAVYMYCGILIFMGIIYLAVGIRRFRVE